MAKGRGRQDLAVGAMASLALVVLAFGIMAVGGDSGLFIDATRYRVQFPEADGLLVGAPVRMAGVQIGTVSKIRLPRDPAHMGIEVELSIDTSYAGRLREDSRAVLRILQILTNEKFVEITPGSQQLAKLDPGARIAPLEAPELFERGEAIAESFGDITVSLKNILEPLERGEGLIGQMIQDPEFGEEGLDALRGTLDNLNGITADLRRGRGFVGRLLTDETLAARLDALGGAIESLSEITASMARGEGAVGDLLRDDGEARAAIADLRAAAGSLRRLTAALEAERGLLGRLINDEAWSEQLAQDLARVAGETAAIVEKVNRGDGTLGALVNERTLHDGAEQIAAGVGDSKFARWLLRRYRKKGIVAQEADAGGD